MQIAQILGAKVSGSCSAVATERARALGVQTVFDYRTTDLSTVRERFDVVYDTAATMTDAVGLGLLRQNGRFVDLNPTPGKFIRSMFNRRLKVVVCTPRSEIPIESLVPPRTKIFAFRSPRSCLSAKPFHSSRLLSPDGSSPEKPSSRWSERVTKPSII